MYNSLPTIELSGLRRHQLSVYSYAVERIERATKTSEEASSMMSEDRVYHIPSNFRLSRYMLTRNPKTSLELTKYMTPLVYSVGQSLQKEANKKTKLLACPWVNIIIL